MNERPEQPQWQEPPQQPIPGQYGQYNQPQQPPYSGYSPQQAQQPGYPPQGQMPGYPPQGQMPGYPPQGQMPGYPPQGQMPGYPQQPVYAEQKDFLTALLLCIFVGVLGVHRFYTGHIGIGIVQLLTLGGCGIWTIIDLIMIASGSYTDSNGVPLRRS